MLWCTTQILHFRTETFIITTSQEFLMVQAEFLMEISLGQLEHTLLRLSLFSGVATSKDLLRHECKDLTVTLCQRVLPTPELSFAVVIMSLTSVFAQFCVCHPLAGFTLKAFPSMFLACDFSFSEPVSW